MRNARGLAACLAMLLLAPAGRGQEPDPRVVRAVAFSPDGKRLAIGTGDPQQPGTVTVWDVAARKSLWSHAEKKGVPAVAFAPDGQTLAIAVYDGAAKLLSAADGKETAAFRHPKEVRAVAFAPNGKLLATACWDGAVRIWDVAEGVVKATCPGNHDRIFSVQFSPDGKLLVSAGGDDGTRLWDAATGKERDVEIPGQDARSVLFSPDGRLVLCAARDGKVHMWDVAANGPRASIDNGEMVDAIAYSPAARALAVVGNVSTTKLVRVFDLPLRDPATAEAEHIRSLLARWDDDSYDVRESAGRELRKVGYIAAAALRRAADESPSVEVRIRARRVLQDVLTQPRAVLRGHTGAVLCVAFSPDGTLLASGGRDGAVRLWDVAAGQEVARLAVE